MNRIQFWILNGLAGFIVLLLLAQILLSRAAGYEQGQMAQAQQLVNQGQAFGGNLQKLALRLVQVSQQNPGDQALKDLLGRQQISFTPQAADAGSTGSPAPAAH